MKFEAKRLNEEIMEDLKKGEGKYKELNTFIINKFGLVEDQYYGWLYENDLRVYQGIDYDVIIDSWFNTQHLDGSIIDKEDAFVVVPPVGYEEYYKDDKLEYLKTKDGLIEAFYNTCMPHCICQSDILEDLYICIDEI